MLLGLCELLLTLNNAFEGHNSNKNSIALIHLKPTWIYYKYCIKKLLQCHLLYIWYLFA